MGNSQVKYAALLFSCEGETVAVTPEIVARLKEGATQNDLAAVCESVGCLFDTCQPALHEHT